MTAPTLRQRPPADTAALADTGLHPRLQRLYAARGVTCAREVDLRLANLAPPDDLLGAAEAALLLADAIEGDARVVIVGDFDADGATSCALGVSQLRAMGLGEISYLVPNRFEFGYGLTPEIVALAAERSPDLIVTVDNGISSIEGVALARELGISVIVTDHHLPGPVLPEADVIVNPNQPGCGFPSKALAGVGVMFYVLTALRAELRLRGWFAARGIDEPNLGDALDLVALGTVADVVPLDYNNRILVAAGLARIRAGRARPGIAALLEVSGRDAARVRAADMGFAVGPRLNAAGRLDDMSVGIECLLANTLGEARPLAEQLHRFNRERRDIEAGMQIDAGAQLDALTLDPGGLSYGVVLFDPGWHQGVVGILASRVRERCHRPAVVFADAGDGDIKGSCRSIEGVHIRDVLERVAMRHPGLVTRFGGHAMAAGLTIARADLDAFREAFIAAVGEWLDHTLPEPVLVTDGELDGGEVGLELAECLADAGPWGQHFPEPSFDNVFEVHDQRIVGERHLRLDLGMAGRRIEAIAFNVEAGRWPDRKVQKIRAVYRLDVNTWRGTPRPQLVIESFWPV